jgi:hypothetical protein
LLIHASRKILRTMDGLEESTDVSLWK